jgi:hypothetical protein
MDDRTDPLNVRLERRGLRSVKGPPGDGVVMPRDIVDESGRVVFRGRALDLSRWLSAGQPHWDGE